MRKAIKSQVSADNTKLSIWVLKMKFLIVLAVAIIVCASLVIYFWFQKISWTLQNLVSRIVHTPAREIMMICLDLAMCFLASVHYLSSMEVMMMRIMLAIPVLDLSKPPTVTASNGIPLEELATMPMAIIWLPP